MTITKEDKDLLSYQKIRYGVRTFSIVFAKDIHETSPFAWSCSRYLRTRFKREFARYCDNHSPDQIVKHMISWVADQACISDKVRDTAIELALDYNPTLRLKLIRIGKNHPIMSASVLLILLAMADTGIYILYMMTSPGEVLSFVVTATLVGCSVLVFAKCEEAVRAGY